MKSVTRILFYLHALSRMPATVLGKSSAAACILSGALGLTAPLIGHAQRILMCKDASGRTVTADRPMPECADRAVRELDRNGIVRREIPAPLTAEQKRQKKMEEEKARAEQAAAAEQKQQDRAIMDRYRNEGEIAIARERTVELVREQSRREAVALAAAQAQRKDALTELGRLKNPKATPPAVQRKLDESSQAMLDAQNKMRDYEAEIVLINAQYNATLKRFQELGGATAAR